MNPSIFGGIKCLIRGKYINVVQEFDYAERHTNIQNEFFDSRILYKAEVLGKLGKTGSAIQEYNKAIKLNNKYHLAYEKIADFYLKLDMKRDALDNHINTGLNYSPNSKSLKKRLHKLTIQK